MPRENILPRSTLHYEHDSVPSAEVCSARCIRLSQPLIAVHHSLGSASVVCS